MKLSSKYARIERERRFLLDGFPGAAGVVRIRRIADHYIDGTGLRLREQSDDSGSPVFKLTQKVQMPASGGQQGFITSLYLTKNEFCVLSQLAAKSLSKTRHSVPLFCIDLFEGALEGLILAEAEFDSPTEADSLDLPGCWNLGMRLK